MLQAIYRDVVTLTQMNNEGISLRHVAQVMLSCDSFKITTLQRARRWARRWHIPGVNHMLRVCQTIVYGIEIDKHACLGTGVYFVHPTAVVIGGNAKIGSRVRFLGSNTVGRARESPNDGYPTIEDDVLVGAGARILGRITVGARSIIGANAVVLDDVPPDSTAVGAPARVRAQRSGDARLAE